MPTEIIEDAVHADGVDELTECFRTQANISVSSTIRNATTRTCSSSHTEKLPVSKPEHHRPLYRVIHSGSPQVSDTGAQKGLYPRLYPIPSRYCKKCLEHYLTSHANINNKTEKTPFTSLTSDLDRAFTIAYKLQRSGETGVRILVVDTCQLDEGTCYGAEDLIECCISNMGDRLYQMKRLFKTEYLVWGSIPHGSIVSTWEWANIESSSIFRVELGLQKNPAALEKIESLRCHLFETVAPNWNMRSSQDKNMVIQTLTRTVAGHWDPKYTSPGYAELVSIHTVIGWMSGRIGKQTYYGMDVYSTHDPIVSDSYANMVLCTLYRMSTECDPSLRIAYSDQNLLLHEGEHLKYREIMEKKHMRKCNGLNLIWNGENRQRAENSKFVKEACPVKLCLDHAEKQEVKKTIRVTFIEDEQEG